MEEYMTEALREAQKAYEENEVPIGCVVVCDDEIIVREHNTKIQDNDSTSHAEMKALRSAQKKLGTKYLYDCTLYVTTEPCAMCAGAIVNCRLGKLVYAVKEPKTGCCGSLFDLVSGAFNHTTEVTAGVKEEEAKALLQKFFKEKRDK